MRQSGMATQWVGLDKRTGRLELVPAEKRQLQEFG
jgi:hypothetical protein